MATAGVAGGRPAWMRVMLVAGAVRGRGLVTREVCAGNRDRRVFFSWLVMSILHKFNDYNELREQS